MSFNRGFRNGDNRTNSSYQSNNQRPMQRLSNISPWEGGVVPNSRPSNSQGLLGLPASSLQQTTANLLSAQQLALASSLLSTLGVSNLPNQQQQQRLLQLQLQQAQQRNDNLPPLLRMARSQMDTMGNGQSSFRQQTQNNYKFNNVPGDRFRSMDATRNRMQQNMTHNRVEPYSRSRLQQPSQQQQQQRRTFVNKPRGDRKPMANPSKQGSAAMPQNAGQKAKFRKPEKVAVSSDSAPKEQQVESKTVDEPLKEPEIAISDDNLAKSANEGDEGVDAKRDWKDEKKVATVEEGVEPPPPPPAIKAEEPDTSVVVDSKEMIVEAAAEEEPKKPKITFQCHICDVTMSETSLLRDHLLLESHKTLMEKTAESYQAQAAALRLNMQEAYGRNDSKQRNNRYDQNREFCKMCSLNFVGSIASHRKLKGHQQLKTFLHPRCLICSKEFTRRIDWDTHKLSVAHQFQEQASLAKAEAKAAAAASGSSGEKVKEVEHKGYQPQKGYGYNYVSEGFYCRVCKMFFTKRMLSRTHLMSKEHYDLCIAFEDNEKAEKLKAVAKGENIDASKEEPASEVDISIPEPSVVEPDVNAEQETGESEAKRPKLSEVDEEDTVIDASKQDEKDMTAEEENLLLSTENEDMEGDVSAISGLLLDDDINMAFNESGLDIALDPKDAENEDNVKTPQKARRGGRGVRGRKRK